MIRSFSDRDTERFADGNAVRRFRAFERVAYRKMKPVHPGEVLVKDFLEPMGISQYRLAKEIHVPLRRVNEIAHCRRGVTADTALRFARYFGTTPEVWQNLQSQYEMDVAKQGIWSRIKETTTPAFERVACLCP